ncbi:DUF4197 domain-containing protein [Polaribacter sp. BAL334]|uniref:DUF4197 domain-containing protein n=1 Tax=Polaribacter sp. BAL334 TaxID=1708178 RepID=UPI0018D20F0F|nr:DUF4197 domain-containing protein [Polaribacter sp. BAL334]MBG7611261.1 DUF4197 domain-containing protein [Polaribacter sp. BAL334]
MKKILLILILATGNVGHAQFQKLFDKIKGNTGLSQEQIGNGLKQALDNGIKNQVTKLTAQDGFYKNELVKILIPDELKAVDKGLRRIGMGNLVDEGIKVLNRAAEDAVKTATPIFVNAVKEITFNDAKNILLGEKNAATMYLETKTQQDLYQSFMPVVEQSFSKVEADKIWNQLISKYNTIPFVKKVNPNLTDYVTNQALKGVFTMIAVEEDGIREKVGLRDTALLKQVFALQDKK